MRPPNAGDPIEAPEKQSVFASAADGFDIFLFSRRFRPQTKKG
jgi:hypothetical protein